MKIISSIVASLVRRVLHSRNYRDDAPVWMHGL
jgi:hypothetical protein